MANPGLSEEEMRAVLQAYHDCGNNQTQAADRLGINRKTFVSRLARAQAKGVELEAPESGVVLPTFPDDDMPAERILDFMEQRFVKRQEHADATKWFRVRVRETAPIGIAWVGDPHLGSNGCNVPLLRRDVRLIAQTPGMYGANLGDTVDGWGGKLIRLYAENDVSKQTERRLARWLLQDSGVKWIAFLLGNHDTMSSEFAAYLQAIGGATVPIIDWSAKFIIEFPNGAEFRIDAAHNHKGTSLWNNLHGQERAAQTGEQADLYIAGHHHTWGWKQEELSGNRVVTLARARGYKWLDDYAMKHQFAAESGGATIVTVLDPTETSPVRRLRPFACVEEGAEFLTWKRTRGATSTPTVKGKRK